jgi:peptidoglycan/LPS O-acetylase OafA/YrhL
MTNAQLAAEVAAAPPQPAGRLPVDPFRGLVCAVIVVKHLYQGTLHGQFERLFGPGVDIAFDILPRTECFFLLSGYFLARSFRPSAHHFSVPRYLLRRMIRLAIPYWVGLAIVVLDLWLPNVLLGRHNEVPSPAKVVANVLFVQDVFDVGEVTTFYWAIAATIQYTVVWAVLYWLARRALIRRAVTAWQAWAVALAVGTCLALAAGGCALTALGAAGHWQLPRVACLIGAGAFIHWAGAGLRAPALATAAGLLAIHALLYDWAAALRAAGGSVALYALANGWQAPDWAAVRGLAYLGRRSYSVLLVHGWAGNRVVNASNHLEIVTGPLAVGFLAAAIAAGVAAGAVFYRLVELPCARLANKIVYKA